LIYFLYLKYKNKEMEIIKFSDTVWQLVDYTGRILKIGTYDECLDRLCEIENDEYRNFLIHTGI
jgi:hypothetical protein